MKPVIHSDLTISFKDVSYKIDVPVKTSHHETLLTPWMKLIDSELRETTDFYRIKNISGVINPGTMTLVLSPPGKYHILVNIT